MNVLVDALPDAVEIGGIEYPIETDFRAALRVILAFEDDELTGFEKQAVLLDNLYPERPHDLQGALEQAIKFLNGGQGQDEEDSDDSLRLYSFSKDAGFIFAAFRQTHGVDLETAEMHWWKFLALFLDLGAETTFCQLVSLRKRIKTGKATKEELKAYRDMRDVIDLPEPRTPEEKASLTEFVKAVEEAKKRRGKAKQTPTEAGNR